MIQWFWRCTRGASGGNHHLLWWSNNLRPPVAEKFFVTKMKNKDIKMKLRWCISPLYPWIFLTLPILREMWDGKSWCVNCKCMKWRIETTTGLPQVWGLQKTTQTKENYIELQDLDPKSLKFYLWIGALKATNSSRSWFLFALEM
jgi:hypothetical protein